MKVIQTFIPTAIGSKSKGSGIFILVLLLVIAGGVAVVIANNNISEDKI